MENVAPDRQPDPAGFAVAILLFLLAGVVWWDLAGLTLSSTYGLGPQAMPVVVALGLAALGGAKAILAFRGEPGVDQEALDPKPILLILGGLGILIVLLALGGGFIVGTAILFAATAAAFGRRAMLADLGIGLVLAAAIYLLFSKLLSLSLPVGPLERLI